MRRLDKFDKETFFDQRLGKVIRYGDTDSDWLADGNAWRSVDTGNLN